MRWLGRLSLLAFLGLALWFLWPYLARFNLGEFFGRNREGWKLELVPRSAVVVAYLAEKEHWLTFPVPAGTQRIRIVSNGNFRDIAAARAARAADPEKRWRYTLEIQVLDGRGEPIIQRIHHHRSNFSEIQEPDGRLLPPAFYLNEHFTPATGVVVNINLAGYPQASRLRIRSTEADQDLADIVVRAYFPEPTSERQVAHLWQRLSEKQKTQLAKGSVYTPELLIEEEQRNLIRNLWQPAGPQGVQGRDFNAREMYVLRDTEGEPVDEPIIPAGIVSAPGQKAVFPIPEEGGEIHFEAQPVPNPEGGPFKAAPAQLAGRWYGINTFARENFSLTWEKPGQAMTRKSAGGMAELEAPYPMALRAFMDVNGQKTEITPEKLYQRLFFAHRQQPVTFAIAHVGEAATPIRLEARYLLPAAPPSQQPLLHYEFLGAQDQVIKAGELPLVTLPSPYDQPIGEPLGTRVSDFTEAYFLVPAEVARLRLSTVEANGENRPPVLVGIFSRPEDLPRQTRAPEDQFAFLAKGEKVPAWFPVRPMEYEALVAVNRSQLLLLQTRPVEEKPEIQAGLFDWEDFRPRGSWLARQVMVPRDPAVPLRDEALVSTFEPLAAGRRQRLDFPPYLGVRELTPSLVWVAVDDALFSARVSLDGRPFHTFREASRYGEVRLPPLPAGRHDIRVDFDKTGKASPALFINHARPGPQAYTTHLAARMEKELVFDVDRTSLQEETVTARLFHPAGWQGRSLLRARIEGPPQPPLTPLPGWVFAERRVDVRPDPSYAAPVFDTQGKRSDAGRPIYIPFPENAPLGRYRIRFTLLEGPPGLLAVSRLTPGVAPHRRILEEPEARHVVIE